MWPFYTTIISIDSGKLLCLSKNAQFMVPPPRIIYKRHERPTIELQQHSRSQVTDVTLKNVPAIDMSASHTKLDNCWRRWQWRVTHFSFEDRKSSTAKVNFSSILFLGALTTNKFYNGRFSLEKVFVLQELNFGLRDLEPTLPTPIAPLTTFHFLCRRW